MILYVILQLPKIVFTYSSYTLNTVDTGYAHGTRDVATLLKQDLNCLLEMDDLIFTAYSDAFVHKVQ